jgi:hypothetical protein
VDQLKDENTALQVQLDKVQLLLKQSVGESEVIKSLQDEIARHKALVEARDKRVKELMQSEQEAVRVREEVKKDLEEFKKERQRREEENGRKIEEQKR